MGGDLYALDFDGVLCDSCGESSLSAVKAAKIRWPSIFNEVDAALEEWIVDQMHILRPVVETGYENLLLVRLLLELQIPSIRKASVSAGLTVDGILENWLELKPVILKEWDEDRDSLIDLFGRVRDEWIEHDFSGWIGANRFYPGVAEALKFSSSTIYIVTTKQSRFANALIRELAGVVIPFDRIYGLGTGPKVKVLKQLQGRPEHQGLRFHFVEDRLATLKNVIKEPELDGWNLYLGNLSNTPFSGVLISFFLSSIIFRKLSPAFYFLAETGKWGYNTEKERQEAEGITRVHLLDLPDFSMKLK